VRSNEKCVGVFNHVSYLDPFVLVAAHARVTSIAKAGIDDMPLIGDLGKAVGILFVARRGTGEASGSSRRGGTVARLEDRRAFCTLVPIRPRRRGERRFLRTFSPGVSLRPPLAFNPRPRRLSTLTDAFQLHPELVYTTFSRAPSRVPFAHDRPGGRHHERRLGREVSDRRVRARVRGAAGVDSVPAESGRVQARRIHRSPYDPVGAVNAVP
jgi:hypothetical protein